MKSQSLVSYYKLPYEGLHWYATPVRNNEEKNLWSTWAREANSVSDITTTPLNQAKRHAGDGHAAFNPHHFKDGQNTWVVFVSDIDLLNPHIPSTEHINHLEMEVTLLASDDQDQDILGDV